jgi:hypothetical protein
VSELDDATKLVASCRDGVLLDTNVLLLLLVGRVDRTLIERCNRTRSYQPADFDLLACLLAKRHGYVLTPHVASETWNLGENRLSGDHQERFKSTFLLYAAEARETWVPVKLLVKENYFKRLGVTDTALIRVKRRRPVVVTDDLALTRQIERERRRVVNFTRLRPF